MATHTYVPLTQSDEENVLKAEPVDLKENIWRSRQFILETVNFPRLSLDFISGLACPVGTIYNHEAPRSLFKAVLFSFEIVLHILLAIVSVIRVTALNEFIADYDHEVEENGFDEERFHQFEEDLEDSAYLDSCFRMCFFSVSLAWLTWNIFTRIIFFCFYNPRKFFDEETGSFVVYEPSLIAKIFFPLATVYYHESNIFKLIPTYFFGCFYSVFFFTPSYKKNQNQNK